VQNVDDRTNTGLVTAGVIFDGDDTLWSTERLYDDARAAARSIVASHRLDAAKWEELERRRDVDNVLLLGHSMGRFPTSCVQAYEEMCRIEGRAHDPSVARRIRRVAESVFDQEAPVIEGARETLELLRLRGVRLALLTKGDYRVQKRRIDSSGLRDLFDLIEIVKEKSSETVRSVVANLGVIVDSAWMVGNSVRSDILPALTAGLRAIWIQAHVWEYEASADDYVDDRVTRTRNLAEIPKLVLA
jgi:putative hydrolase of the HAD superfamily